MSSSISFHLIYLKCTACKSNKRKKRYLYTVNMVNCGVMVWYTPLYILSVIMIHCRRKYCSNKINSTLFCPASCDDSHGWSTWVLQREKNVKSHWNVDILWNRFPLQPIVNICSFMLNTKASLVYYETSETKKKKKKERHLMCLHSTI